MDLFPDFMERGVFAAACVLITGMATLLVALLRYIFKTGQEKVSDVDNRVDGVETGMSKKIEALEYKFNSRLDNIEKRVGDIVTEDISKLYREIATLQGDIKVLATELKNLNTNISTLFSNMSNDVMRTITQALAAKENN